jgi:hypothetical protein
VTTTSSFLDEAPALDEDLMALESLQGEPPTPDQSPPPAPTPQQGSTPSSTASTAATDIPPWKRMMTTSFGIDPDASDDDDEDRPHKRRTQTGDLSSMGAYEDFIADHWSPGETSMEVAIFRGEPETMRGHNDARFDVCFHVNNEPIEGDVLVEKLRSEYGGGLFRLRFFEEKAGRQPFTAIKKSFVISVEEDPIFKARLGKHLTQMEEKRLDTKRTIERERMEFSAQDRMINLLEQQRREAVEEMRRLRDGGQGTQYQEMLLKLISEQLNNERENARRAKEEAKMTENVWMNLLNETAKEREESQQRIMQTAMSSQERMFELLSKQDNGTSPIMLMMMQQRQEEAERRKEEREREALRQKEEAERRREERERERLAQQQQMALLMQMMQQQSQAQQQSLQLMLAMQGNDKNDSFAKIATVLAGSPVVAKLLDKPANAGNEMMQILLPLMTNDKQNAEKRAQMLEQRMMEVLEKKNDPKQGMMELIQMMQVMQGMQKMMNPQPVVPEKDEDEEDSATTPPAWMGAAGDLAEKFGLGRVAEAVASSLLSRAAAPAQPAAAAPPPEPRAPRVAPLAPPIPQPQLPPSPVVPQALPAPQVYPEQPPQMQPQPVQSAPPQAPQPAQNQGNKKMTPEERNELLNSPPPDAAKDLFNEIEKAMSANPQVSPFDFSKSRSFAEKMVLRAILPKDMAVEYVRKHATDKPSIQSMEGLQWLKDLVNAIY